MKYLAIDYGLKRVGIAVSDDGGQFAFPRRTLRRETKAAFFAELLALLEEERAEAIVVGLPLLPDGKECLTTKQVRHFIESLKRRTALPLYWVDEVFSSAVAEEELFGFGLNYGKVHKVLDQQAAVLILESFLGLPEDRRQRA